MLKKNRLYFLFVFLIGCTAGWIFYEYSVINDHSNEPLPVIQNDKNDIFYGETLYPEQIKAVIKKYNQKYNINIFFAETDKDFLKFLDKMKISDNPKAIFKYNEGHKYGFIFLKYNGLDYCVCIDTIPTLSEYTNKLTTENGDLFIDWSGRRYKAMMFGENLQKAQKGCGSFTLAIFKQLLKNNAKYLFEALDVYSKYGTEDKSSPAQSRMQGK